MGMSQTGCCCKETCDGTEDICCLLCTVNGGYLDGLQFFVTKRSWAIPDGDTQPYAYTPDELCNSDVGVCNNAKGTLRGPYFNHNTRSNDPFVRYSGCLGSYRASWYCTPGETPTVTMRIGASGYACGADRYAGYPINNHVGHVWSMNFVNTDLPLDWHTDDVVLENSVPGIDVTLTVSVCPEEFDLFPPEAEAVRFNVKFEKRDLLPGGVEVGPWVDTYCFALDGDKFCGSGMCGGKLARYYYTDNGTVELELGVRWDDACLDGETLNPSGKSYHECIDFDGGNWPTTWEYPTEEVVGYGWNSTTSVCYANLRLTIEKVESGDPCPECSTAEDPPEEDGVCFTENPCFEVFAPTTEPGEGYQSTCHLDMERVTTTEVNYSGSCDAPEEFLLPSGNTAIVEVSMIRDEGSRPSGAAPGSQTYVVTITIRDSVTNEIVDQHTFVVSIVCSDSWSIYDIFEFSGYDPEYTGPTTLEIRIGAKCSGVTLTPPEPCDPGCWPECVMCPERKSLYAVVSDAPDCCLSGSYALTWVGTGGGGAPTVGYYELPATVGGPMYTCGQITFLRVFCVDASHITVQLVYLRAEGEEISNLSSPATLAVTCDGSGNLESEPIHVPGRSGGRESLCGFGSDVGGDIRIVSA